MVSMILLPCGFDGNNVEPGPQFNCVKARTKFFEEEIELELGERTLEFL